MPTEIDQLIAAIVKEGDKTSAIKSIQDFVFDSEGFLKLDERMQDIFSEFAYDLDFYVPDPDMRKEDPSYYGEERLNEEIAEVIKKLDQLKRNDSQAALGGVNLSI
jgi:hypothetical protein